MICIEFLIFILFDDGVVIWMGTDWNRRLIFFRMWGIQSSDMHDFTVNFQGQKLRKRLGSLIVVIDLQKGTISNKHFPSVRP